jgi:hypothetical protein
MYKELSLTPPYQIRQAVTNDERNIRACLKAAFAPYRTEYTPEGFADTVLDSETIQRRLGEMRLFMAVSEGKIVGTIG